MSLTLTYALHNQNKLDLNLLCDINKPVVKKKT